MEILRSFEVDLQEIWNAEEGTAEEYELELELDEILQDFRVDSELTGVLQLIRIPDGILTTIKKAEIQLTVQCVKCLENASFKLVLKDKSRTYVDQDFQERLGEISEENLFRIDRERLILNLQEFLREELLLAIPRDPYCKPDCRGLCSECGQNLNLGKCKCEKQAGKEENPFQKLKDMLKAE